MRIALAALLTLASSIAVAQSSGSIEQAVNAALQSDIRTEDERARDENRRAPEVLAFFGLEPDMRVIEILPASGWYSKVLGLVLADEGQLYVTHPAPTFYSDLFEGVTDLEGLGGIEEIPWGATAPEGSGPFFGSGEWDVEPVDMVLTFRNYHNFNYEGRMAINQSAYDALKPGGVYGVVDHTRRHMEPDSRENGRRVDPLLAVKEIQSIGFELADYTDLLRRTEDELDLEVGNQAVSGRTDRFTIMFVKPE